MDASLITTLSDEFDKLLDLKLPLDKKTVVLARFSNNWKRLADDEDAAGPSSGSLLIRETALRAIALDQACLDCHVSEKKRDEIFYALVSRLSLLLSNEILPYTRAPLFSAQLKKHIKKVLTRNLPDQCFQAQNFRSAGKGFSFEITHCLYHSLFKKYRKEHLTPFFCLFENRMADILKPKLSLEKKQTLPDGGDCCCFLFK